MLAHSGTSLLQSLERTAYDHLFSLGVILYQLYSRQRPFFGESMAQLMFKIASDGHPEIRGVVPGISECLALIGQGG